MLDKQKFMFLKDDLLGPEPAEEVDGKINDVNDEKKTFIN